MNRESFEKKIKNLLQKKVNILLIGGKGIGKTFLVKKFSNNYLNNSSFNKTELEELTGMKGSGVKLFKELLKMKRFVLGIELENLTEKRKKLVEEVSETKTIIASSRVEIELNSFITLKVNKLNEEELLEIISEVKLSEIEKKLLMRKSKGNVGNLMNLTNTYLITGKIKKINFKISRKELISILLSVRYSFLIIRQFEIYAIVSMVAYMLRSLQYRKK